MNVFAVICDIVQSKSISEREKFQENLEDLFKNLNQKSKNKIISPYTITLGDEFQVIYNSLDALMIDVFKIIERIYPHKLRISIGYGQLLTKINKESALGMDGPAFYSARKGIDELKKYKKNIIKIKYDSKYTNDCNSKIIELYLTVTNQNLLLISNDMEGWKINTIKIINRLLNNNDNVSEIAEELNLSKNSVYKNIRNNHLIDIVDCFRIINDGLAKELVC